MSSNNEPTESNSNTPSNASLQQMLAISTSLTNQENPNPISSVNKDRMNFFFNGLQKLEGSYQDDIEVIKESLNELRNWSGDSEYLKNNCSQALRNIMELVDHIDVASDFMKLEGLPVVCKFLTVDDPEIIRKAADIIGTSCQNHPKVQKAVIDDPNIFPNLFAILKSSDYDDRVKLKSVFAISSTIQNNAAGHDKFKKMNGYDVFLNILRVAELPLKLRLCFVLDCLCTQFPEIRSVLLEKQYINCLVELLTSIPVKEPKETVLSAMLTFIEGFYDAICECKKKEHNLIPTLEYLMVHYYDTVREERDKAVKLKEELDRFQTEIEMPQ